MLSMELYPLKFHPIYKEKIWGGKNLKTIFNRDLPKNKKIGESWEVSDHKDDISIIKNGIYRDISLRVLIEKYKERITGKKNLLPSGRFPLLFKYIDAQDTLSLQVHPPDNYEALAKENEIGKTECWFIVKADKDAELVLGLKNVKNKSKFLQLIKDGNIEKYLNKIKVTEGDFIFLPPGIIHTIGKGIVLAEIQENSDATYRIWDWGRKGENGKPREIHIDKAIDVIDFSINPGELIKRQNTLIPLFPPLVKGDERGLAPFREGGKRGGTQAKAYGYRNGKKFLYQENKNFQKLLVRCPYFSVRLHHIYKNLKIDLKSKFKVFSFIDGHGIIVSGQNEIEIGKGETMLIPVELEQVSIQPSGKLVFLSTSPG